MGILILQSYAVLLTDNTDVSAEMKYVMKRWACESAALTGSGPFTML
jgi:hypothetical protein